MKRFYQSAGTAVCAFFLLFVFQGCLKDTYRETYTLYYPVYKTLTEVRTDMKSSAARPLQNTGKLNVFGNYIFLNELEKGIHVIDNTNPSSPKNIAFINIPANVDLAIKGNFLYADSYSDVAVFDISNPTTIRAVAFLNNVIRDQNRYWYANNPNPDSIKVVVGYVQKDTTVTNSEYRRWANCANCLYAAGDSRGVFTTSASAQTGVGGSMSRFTIVNNYLYAVSNSELYAINIANGEAPQLASSKNMGWNIETIYPFKDRLFIGSRTGMFIYNLNNPADPAKVSQFDHARSCDPVIADDNYAYVTLRSGTNCNATINQLDVIDVSNLAAPVRRKTVPMTNPHGLAKDGNKLFICDGKAGLKLFDASTPTAPQLVNQIPGIETYDVIALNGRAIVVAKDGLYQYDYTNGNNLTQLSKITIESKN